MGSLRKEGAHITFAEPLPVAATRLGVGTSCYVDLDDPDCSSPFDMTEKP
jgi:hypothetical protein